jgi:hypothetical protein
VDDRGAGHRLDHRADGLAVGLRDPAGEAFQRVDVWGDGELVEVFSVVAQKADVEALSAEIQSGVQHVGGPPWCS